MTNPPYPPQQPGGPQQPGYPQQPGHPQQWPSAPQPAKKSNTTRTVLIIVGVLLALCCVGGGVGGFLLYKGVDSATAGVSEGASAYLDDLRDGDYPGAYARICRSQRALVDESTFAQVVGQGPKLVEYEITGRRVKNNNGVMSGSVDVRGTLEDGTKNSETLQMTHEDGEWRVCS